MEDTFNRSGQFLGGFSSFVVVAAATANFLQVPGNWLETAWVILNLLFNVGILFFSYLGSAKSGLENIEGRELIFSN